MARVLVGMVALLVALATHVVGAAWTFFETCRISDTADRVPAPASVQGRFCDAQDHWLNVAPFVVFGASILIAVVLAVTWWGTGRRWLGLTSGVWLAVASTVLVALPPDTCTDSQRRDVRSYACDTRGNA